MPNSVHTRSAGERRETEDKISLWVARVGLFCLILFACIGLQPFQVSDNIAASASGDSLRQVLFVAFFFAAMFAAVDRYRLGVRLFIPTEWVLILILCWISASWAIEFSISVRRLLLTTFIIMSAFAFVKVLNPRRAATVTWQALVSILVINYVSVALVPAAVHLAVDFTDESIIGAWRGAVRHKNIAGPLCVITCFYALYLGRIPRWQRVGVMVLACFFLVKSQSKTSMGIGCISVVFTYAMLFARRLPKLLVTLEALLVLALGFVVLWVISPLIGAALSDGSALTGRATIWPALLAFVDSHWLLGAGYGSFWVIGDKSPIYEFGAGWVTELAQGHNGYLDLTVQIGVPLAAAVIFLGLVWPLLRLFNSPLVADEYAKIALSTTCFVIGQNFTETTFLDRDAPVFVLLLIALGLVDRRYWGGITRRYQRGRRVSAWRFNRSSERYREKLRSATTIAPKPGKSDSAPTVDIVSIT